MFASELFVPQVVRWLAGHSCVRSPTRMLIPGTAPPPPNNNNRTAHIAQGHKRVVVGLWDRANAAVLPVPHAISDAAAVAAVQL